MSSTELDLNAYFDRINDDGSREITLNCLNAIIEAHISAIPFETLDVLFTRPFFQHSIIVAKSAAAGVSKTIHNKTFSIRTGDGKVEKFEITFQQRLLKILRYHFDINLSEDVNFDLSKITR